MLNGGLVSWCSKSQLTVALSSTKAKYIALTLAAKEATWLHSLTELGLLKPDDQHPKINVRNRNSSASTLLEDDSVRGGEQPKTTVSNKPSKEKGSNLTAQIPLKEQTIMAQLLSPTTLSSTLGQSTSIFNTTRSKMRFLVVEST